MTNHNLSGIFPALMTMLERDRFDPIAQKKLVTYLADSGVHGLYVGGSSGEMLLLSEKERMELLECVKDAAGELGLIAHIGATSTAETLELARHAARVGADALSSVTPLYFKYSFAEVKRYYERIAEVGLPVIIYNIPVLTGSSYGYKELAELLSIEGIAGMKFTSSDFFLLNRLKTDFPDKVFYNGSDEMLLSGLAAGADGGIGTTYNFMPDVILEIYRSFRSGELAAAGSAQSFANKVIAAVIKYGAVPASKLMLGFEGFGDGLCREPFLPLDEEARRELRETAYLPLCERRK